MKQHKRLEEIWEQVPPDYYQNGVKNNSLQRFWHRNKLQQVLVAIKQHNRQPDNILDIGCASGWFLSELAKKFPRAKSVGVDVYKEAISYGNKKYAKLKLLEGDAHDLPFKNNSFEVIICCEVLEHVVQPNKVLKEIHRIIKPGGVVIIEIDSGNFLFKLVWFWWTTLRKGVWKDSHLHPFNITILKKLFLANGFTIEQQKTFNFSMAVIFTLKPLQKNH